jgi:predicted metal-dependent hydrolase
MRYSINNQDYEVVIIKKNNKNTYIRVKDLKIMVTTSYFTSKSAIIKLLKQNEKTLIKMLNKSVKRQKETLDFYYLGLKYDIIIMPSIASVTIDNNVIYASSEKQLNKYLKETIAETFKERYDYVLNMFEENIPTYNLKIRNMKTRWGVCNRKSKTITLNSRLIRYNIDTIDYVIIHELAHLIWFNHSKDFWLLVQKYCPNYKKVRKELKE